MVAERKETSLWLELQRAEAAQIQSTLQTHRALKGLEHVKMTFWCRGATTSSLPFI